MKIKHLFIQGLYQVQLIILLIHLFSLNSLNQAFYISDSIPKNLGLNKSLQGETHVHGIGTCGIC